MGGKLHRTVFFTPGHNIFPQPFLFIISSPPWGQAAQATVSWPLSLPAQRKIGNGKHYEYSNDYSIGKYINSDKLLFGIVYQIFWSRYKLRKATIPGPLFPPSQSMIYFHILYKIRLTCFFYKDLYFWTEFCQISVCVCVCVCVCVEGRRGDVSCPGQGIFTPVKLPRPQYLAPIPSPFLFREKQVMVDMNILMTNQ